MRYLLISLVTSFILALSACGSAPVATTHPYIQSAKDFETRAVSALKMGQYQQAHNLYGRSLRLHQQLDDKAAIARLLINQFQIALTIESLDQASVAETQLQLLKATGQIEQFASRLTLLSANKAILDNNWPLAESLLADITQVNTPLYPSALISTLVLKQKSGQTVTATLEQADIVAAEQALLTARLLRIKAELALQQTQYSTALQLSHQAKKLYQQAIFLPGIAECLALEYLIFNTNDKPQQAAMAKQRALSIWQNIGNRQAAHRFSK